MCTNSVWPSYIHVRTLPADVLMLLPLEISCIIQYIRWSVWGNLIVLCYILFSVVLIAVVFGCFTNCNNSCQLPHEENRLFFSLIFQNSFQQRSRPEVCAIFSQLGPNHSVYVIISTVSCSSKAQLQ